MTAGTPASFPMSNHSRERVTVAKLTLENFYSNLILQHEERETRQKKLEVAMEEEGLADEEVIELRFKWNSFMLVGQDWCLDICKCDVNNFRYIAESRKTEQCRKVQDVI
ncbi:UNVERIFIED_CONTAM: hypothetical protein K2H54_007434 [Gekko kuhli]